MKRNMCAALIFCVLSILILAGCQDNHAPKETMAVTAESTEESVLLISEIDPTAVVNETSLKKIDVELKENHQIHAAVYAPDIQELPSCKLEPLQFDPQAVAAVLIPDDSSPFTVDYDEMRKSSTLTTENGNVLRIGSSSILLWNEDQSDPTKFSKYDTILNLLTEYAESNPDHQNDSLTFMTMEEAIQRAENIFKELGLCWQPVLQTSIGMDHQQIMQYQQERFPEYDGIELQKTPVLDNLTQEDDAYLLTFGFSHNAVPIYGFPQEPDLEIGSDSPIPVYMSAEMIITPQGITLFNLTGGYKIVETDVRPLLSAEEAVAKYKQKWDSTILPLADENWEVYAIYLEYITKWTDGSPYLTPYWCLGRDAMITNQLTGETAWSRELGFSGQGARFNAFTGEELLYGG